MKGTGHAEPKKARSAKKSAKKATGALPKRFTSKAEALHFARRMRLRGHHVTVKAGSKSRKAGSLRSIVARGKAPLRRDWPGHPREHGQAAAFGWRKTISAGRVRRPTFVGPRRPQKRKTKTKKRR